jgi:hypothetical protein
MRTFLSRCYRDEGLSAAASLIGLAFPVKEALILVSPGPLEMGPQAMPTEAQSLGRTLHSTCGLMGCLDAATLRTCGPLFEVELLRRAKLHFHAKSEEDQIAKRP